MSTESGLCIALSGFEVRMVADSISPGGVRISTVAATYPRFIHSEVLTHRDLSRNSASSRAIPASKLAARVQRDPAVPVEWGANQSGMQATSQIADAEAALAWWLRGRDLMVQHHAEGVALGLHKQLVNRVIEPWMKITVILTATRFANLLYQRDHPAAQPEFQHLAKMVRLLRQESTPKSMTEGEWHAPFIRQADFDEYGQPRGPADRRHPVLMVSVGRCARVSYLNHDGQRDPAEDIKLARRLEHADQPAEPGHWSPFEHCAMALADRDVRSGNLHGWLQLRKFFAREYREETTGPGSTPEQAPT